MREIMHKIVFFNSPYSRVASTVGTYIKKYLETEKGSVKITRSLNVNSMNCVKFFICHTEQKKISCNFFPDTKLRIRF